MSNQELEGAIKEWRDMQEAQCEDEGEGPHWALVSMKTYLEVMAKSWMLKVMECLYYLTNKTRDIEFDNN